MQRMKIVTPFVAALLVASVSVFSTAASLARAAEPAHPGFQVLQKRCFQCHGDGGQLSGLDLRTAAGAAAGGKHGAALKPGRPDESRLLQMVTGKIKPAMPPAGALSDAEVEALRGWIQVGAPYPAGAGASGGSKWWAFRPLAAAAPGSPRAAARWIDALIERDLHAAGIAPVPPAPDHALLRRAFFDLHGLPPSPADLTSFRADRTPLAWERLVDRLLQSPRYGERYARHWLDLARFAESEGFKSDETRPDAWRYRDYVIQSLNADKPYDRFIQEQIAGDELWPDDPQALVATAFNRHWADESNARNIPLRRQEILNDITDTVGSVAMGLTVGCARCHDHKYDEFSQKNYYQLQAFFAAVHPRSDVPLLTGESYRDWQRRRASWEEATRSVRAELEELEKPYRARLIQGKRMPFPPEVQEAIDTPDARRTALQWQIYLKVKPQITLSQEDLEKAIKNEAAERRKALLAELNGWSSMKPEDLPVTLGVTDVGSEAPPTFVLDGGVYNARGEEVQPGFPTAIDTSKPQIIPPPGLPSTGRRSALARWLTSPANPVAARVIVNRVWQFHFGKGLVPTSSDFGRAGELPTHPELLDRLAAEFVANGWSLKWLHRAIMSTSAYRRATHHSPAAAKIDPSNRLYWRFDRLRLEGEAVRDAALAVSGELNPRMGGPSVMPPLPEGVTTRGGWTDATDPRDQSRRSVYIFVRRNLRYPLFEAFDFPDTHEPCARRNITNTPIQALMLLNGHEMLGRAAAFASRIVASAPSDEGRIRLAFRLAYAREAAPDEVEQSRAFLGRQTQIVKGRIEGGRPALTPPGAAGLKPERGAAWVDFCHALLNSNEFIYLD